MTKRERINPTTNDVRKFGLTFAVICFAVVGLMLFTGNALWAWFACGVGFFLVTGIAGYPVLRPVYIGWMKFAFVLGWINTRLLLGFFFYFILTPIGLLMRLLRKDLLDEKLEPEADSYWKKRMEAFDRQRMERQF